MDNRLKGCNRVTMTSSKYQPKSKPLAYRPLAPSVTCGDSSLPEGAISLCHFTLACAFGEAPTVNPSVTPPACQLPLAREPLGCSDEAPLAKGGCLGTAEAGGFRRQSLRNFLPIPSSLFPKKPSPFHMGSYFGKVPAVESLSHGYAVPAPFGKGAFGCGIDTGRVREVAIRRKPS